MAKLTAEQEWLATQPLWGERLPVRDGSLEKYCPVEFGITCRYLERYVPNNAVVADVGVGVGHYAEFLARRGCSVYLVDISVELLQAARQRLERAGLGGQVQEVRRASATDLGWLRSGSLDAVLMLGPFYHLQELHERRQAVSEARRILKPQGILFAAAVNRLAYLRDLFREKPAEVLERAAFHARFLKDGKLDPEHAPPLGYAHLTNALEFRNLFEDAFEEVALVGTESFVSAWQSKLNELPPDAREAWLDLVEETGKTPEGIGQSDHFLFIGKRL